MENNILEASIIGFQIVIASLVISTSGDKIASAIWGVAAAIDRCTKVIKDNK